MKLTRDQWSQVEALFDEACGQVPDLRLDWLQRIGGQRGVDDKVLDEVQGLIEASDEGLPEPGIVLISMEASQEATAAGETFGPWRVVRLIGRGGMGEVYLAERADGAYQQQVAVKLLKRGVDTDAVIRRFLRERRILGRLSHPNIARLFDAGATRDGRPYLVMELVLGQPISEWCASHQLGVRPVLELMVTACEAVHAAHRQLVVHRDLKPTNVLVGDDGTVKLLDFGIAKLLGEDEVEGTQTLLGNTPATPRYATPEQLLGQPVTPASDVYSLGMLLYELLTGTLPPWRRSTLLAIAGASSRTPAPRPSAVVQTSECPLFANTAARKRRAQELAGDIDSVVLKAIEHLAPQRYASAAQLADDLRRALDGRPVSAQPQSWAYRAGKFVARNWVPVSAAAAVIVALLVGLAMALWQARIAGVEARRADRVKDYLVEIFKAADPERSQRTSMTAREILDQGVRKMEITLVAEPALQADLYDTLANTYLNLGDEDRALQLARKALEIRRQRFPPGDERVAESLLTVGNALLDKREFQASATALDEADRIIAAGADRDSLAAARIEDSRASTMKELGHRDPAVALQRRAYALFLRLAGPNDPDSAKATYDLASCLEEAGMYDESALYYRKAIAAIEVSQGADSMAAGSAHLNYGSLLDRTGDSAGSLREHNSAIEILHKTLGGDHPLYADALFSRAIVFDGLRRYAECDADLRETLRIYAPGSYKAGQSLRYLSHSLMKQGRLAEARTALTAALDALRKNGPDDMQYYRALADFSRLQLLSGALKEAEAGLRGAISNLERLVGPEGYEVRTPLRLLGQTLVAERRYEEALTVLRRVQALEQKLFGASKRPADTVQTSYLLAAALVGVETAASRAEAGPLIEQAVDYFRRQQYPGPELGSALLVRAELLAADGNEQASHADLLEAQEQLAHAIPPDTASAVEVRRRLGVSVTGTATSSLTTPEKSVAGSAAGR